MDKVLGGSFTSGPGVLRSAVTNATDTAAKLDKRHLLISGIPEPTWEPRVSAAPLSSLLAVTGSEGQWQGSQGPLVASQVSVPFLSCKNQGPPQFNSKLARRKKK